MEARMRLISQMRHRFDLQAPVHADDGAGGVVRSYSTVKTIWVAIEHFRRKADVSEDRLITDVTHKITMRFNPNLTRLHRLKQDNRIFTIKSIERQDELGFYQTLLCEEEAL
jgi:SPP1 family predicted phage head-tail adaptor